MEGTLRCTLGSQAQQAHSLEDHTRSIQQSTSTHTKHSHNIIQQNSNHTETYCELFHQTIYIHTLIRSCYIPIFQAQSLNSSQTTSRDTKHTQHIEITNPHNVNSKPAFHKVLSPTLFNIYTADIPPPRAPVQVMAYVDGITITSTHTITSAAKKSIQPYLHKLFAWTKQNNLNPDKTTCTLFTPDPAEYKSNLHQKINNTALPMATHPKVLGVTLDSNSHTTHTPLQLIKTLTATGWTTWYTQIAYSTSRTYHTQSSPEMWTHTPLSGTRTLMTTEDN